MKRMIEMNDEELRELSKRKNNKNIATPQALMAQAILWERNRIPETDYHRTYMDDFYGDRN